MFIFQMALPKGRTNYMCAVFEMPRFNETHHMIKVGIFRFNYLKKQNKKQNKKKHGLFKIEHQHWLVTSEVE